MSKVLSVEWIPEKAGQLSPGHLRILDQTRLPTEVVFTDTMDPQRVWQAIRDLEVRGAPAIGVTAAMGVAAAAQAHAGGSVEDVLRCVDETCAYLATSRPTAVNLFWALERMQCKARACAEGSADALVACLVREAVTIRDEDAAMCRAIGRHAVTLLHEGATVLTHCNAGALATAEYGTALAPFYAAAEQGMTVHVYADETRPLLQGARLTAWELMNGGIDVTLICDNMAAHVMRDRGVDAVMVGADRIAANGDTANKIGTYGLAVLARAHDIPFYVLAPTSTIDPRTADGRGIPIEERGADEVTHGFGRQTAPDGCQVYAPAFDVTPAEYIAAIVCEKGIARPDFGESLRRMRLEDSEIRDSSRTQS